ncbi:energy-coupling factor transporter transmembrane component T family protein [Candidatus Margulisiibacteriota bacterium]
MVRLSKILLLLLLMLAVFLISPAWLMVAFLFVFLISIFVKRSLKKIVRKLRPAIFFGALILLMYTLTADLYSGLSLALRFILVFWLAQIMVEEMQVQVFISSMARWKLFNPLFRRLGLMLMVATVSFPIIYRESKNIYEAHISRGLDFKKGKVSGKIKNLLYFMNVFFVKVFDRVEALSSALESRIPHFA